ncbi:uncharacterized protein ATNIH1004_008476 [Aspergillus tanneri]|uniref:Uncharacterized protein n=1 Tax=Aspergillus tanneri TaxID=1220188 RepID=A0A5M9MNP3_9EURO|nr:uncharacterized protein ATNIH1004_008476 [Aspergillus tanneri]KAA8644277.1 hypothetical protein ATNIH1004_008476 [Aspergillus tanneri]
MTVAVGNPSPAMTGRPVGVTAKVKVVRCTIRIAAVSAPSSFQYRSRCPLAQQHPSGRPAASPVYEQGVRPATEKRVISSPVPTRLLARYIGFLMSKLGYFTRGIFLALLLRSPEPRCCTVKLDTPTSAIYGYNALIGIGGGSYFMSSFGVAPAVVAPSEIFDAIGVLSVGQGLAIFSFPYGGKYQLLPVGDWECSSDHLTTEQQAQVAHAIVKALDMVYLPAIAGSALSFLASLFLGKGAVNWF